MNKNFLFDWYIVVLSSFLYAIGFVAPHYFFWTPLVWPLLLFLFVSPTWKKGLLWGLVGFGIQLIPFFVVTFRYGEGTFRQLLPSMFVLYFAGTCSVWFFVTQSKRGWLATIPLFCLYLNFLILWPFGNVEGYPLANPLLPLIHCINYFPCPVKVSDDIICVQPKATYRNRRDALESVCEGLVLARQRYPKASIFVMPESSYPYPISKRLCRVVSEHVLGQNKLLIMGTHREQNNKLYNCASFIHQSRITLPYDKNHLILFFEDISPTMIETFNIHSVFLEGKDIFSKGEGKGGRTAYFKGVAYMPIICSELMWSARNMQASNFVCLMNDSYFKGTWIPTLMLFYAQYRALKKGICGVYCSHLHSFYIDSYGRKSFCSCLKK